MSVSVRVVGMEGFQREVAGIRALIPGYIHRAEQQIATLIVERARGLANQSRINVAGFPTRAGAANVATIRANTGKPVSVQYGGLPSSMGHEFGGFFYRQFPPFLGKTGYFFYPSIRATRSNSVQIYTQTLAEMFRPAFPH